MPGHIVLDLDECLLKMFHSDWDTYATIMQDPKMFGLRTRVITIQFKDGTRMWGIKRPYLDEFLSYCSARFDTVSVWSAGISEYVHLVSKEIFKDTRSPDIILTRDDIESDNKDSYWKPLDKFFSAMTYKRRANSHVGPWNTYFLDNRVENFVKNVRNGVHIPDFNPRATVQDITAEDKSLMMFMQFCAIVTDGDVREIEKSRVFTEELSHSHQKPSFEYFNNFRNPLFRLQ